jgi:hypothetical protein
MEELKNQDKKEGHHHSHHNNSFRDCISGHCHNCNMGHKVGKILIVIFIVWALISIGVAMGSQFNRFEGRGEFGQNKFMMEKGGCGFNNFSDDSRGGNQQFQNQRGEGQNFNGGCGQQVQTPQFNNQANVGGCAMQGGAQGGTQCNNPSCPLNQATPSQFVPVNPTPEIPTVITQ